MKSIKIRDEAYDIVKEFCDRNNLKQGNWISDTLIASVKAMNNSGVDLLDRLKPYFPKFEISELDCRPPRRILQILTKDSSIINIEMSFWWNADEYSDDVVFTELTTAPKFAKFRGF